MTEELTSGKVGYRPFSLGFGFLQETEAIEMKLLVKNGAWLISFIIGPLCFVFGLVTVKIEAFCFLLKLGFILEISKFNN